MTTQFKKTPKFKVGDRVRRIASPFYFMPIGSEWIVTGVDGINIQIDSADRLTNPGDTADKWFGADYFELVLRVESRPKFAPGDVVKRINSGYAKVERGGVYTVSKQVSGSIYLVHDPRLSYSADGFELVHPALSKAATPTEFIDPGLNDGDLVKLTKGDEVYQGLVRTVETFAGSRMRAARQYPGNHIGATVYSLMARGFKLEIIKRAQPPLPTKPGVYTTAVSVGKEERNNLYALSYGQWIEFQPYTGTAQFVSKQQVLGYLELRKTTLVRLDADAELD